MKRDYNRLVQFESYLSNSLTSSARYNPRIMSNIDDVNKLFVIVGRFHVEVDLDIFSSIYKEKFIRHKHLDYIEKFLKTFESDLFQVMLIYKLSDGQLFTFDFKFAGAIYRKEIKCYMFSKIL